MQWKEMKPIYQIHVYFAEKVQALLYVKRVHIHKSNAHFYIFHYKTHFDMVSFKVCS